MKIHDWRTRSETEENRLWRATKHGSRWEFMSRLQHSEEGWTNHEEMNIDELKTFREVLLNKYQRRRIPWEDVLKIDNMIEEVEIPPTKTD